MIDLKDFLKRLKYKLLRLFKYNNPFKYDKEEIQEYMSGNNEYPNNFINYPYNIYEPDKVNVYNTSYVRYRARFNSLHDLYSYLKSNPKLNRKIFNRLSSETGEEDFAGIKYSDALEELELPPRIGYREFLELSEGLNNDALDFVQDYETIPSPAGGYIDIPSYASGNPLCYRTSRSIYIPKFIRVQIMLSYFWGTTKEQVLNRALIIASLVNAFERAGYVVEINTFEVSREFDEFIDIDVNIKNNDETFNKASLYKTLCYVEFLRRILFRVLETLDVKNDWQRGYGETCPESFVREAKKFNDNDIFFDQPCNMGIQGKDISKDFESVISYLKLEDKIDVTKAKKEFEKDILTLKRTIK